MFCRFDRFHKRPVNFHRYWWNSHRLGGDSHRCWRNSHRFGRNSHRCWRNSHRMRRNFHRMRRSSHRMRRNSHRTRRNFRLPSTWWRLSPVGAAVYFRRSSCNFGGIIFVSFVFSVSRHPSAPPPIALGSICLLRPPHISTTCPSGAVIVVGVARVAMAMSVRGS